MVTIAGGVLGHHAEPQVTQRSLNDAIAVSPADLIGDDRAAADPSCIRVPAEVAPVIVRPAVRLATALDYAGGRASDNADRDASDNAHGRASDHADGDTCDHSNRRACDNADGDTWHHAHGRACDHADGRACDNPDGDIRDNAQGRATDNPYRDL
jgi:hypothetical protein